MRDADSREGGTNIFYMKADEIKKISSQREEKKCNLPFALTGGLSLLLALYAGLLVVLTLTHFLENAAAGALPLESFERTFQGLIFANTNLRHFYPSPRS